MAYNSSNELMKALNLLSPHEYDLYAVQALTYKAFYYEWFIVELQGRFAD